MWDGRAYFFSARIGSRNVSLSNFCESTFPFPMVLLLYCRFAVMKRERSCGLVIRATAPLSREQPSGRMHTSATHRNLPHLDVTHTAGW